MAAACMSLTPARGNSWRASALGCRGTPRSPLGAAACLPGRLLVDATPPPCHLCRSACTHGGAWSRRRAGAGARVAAAAAGGEQQAGAPTAAPASVPEEEVRLRWDHVLLAITDSAANPYLSDGSKTATATAASMAAASGAKVTVLLVDDKQPPGDAKVRLDSIAWQMKDKGCGKYEFLEKEAPSFSVAVGDVADEIGADVLVMSSSAVHGKQVDANLLAEFVPCPIMLLP